RRLCHTVRVHVCARLLPLSSSERTHTSKRRTGSVSPRQTTAAAWRTRTARSRSTRTIHRGAEGHRLCRRASRRSLPLSDDAHHRSTHIYRYSYVYDAAACGVGFFFICFFHFGLISAAIYSLAHLPYSHITRSQYPYTRSDSHTSSCPAPGYPLPIGVSCDGIKDAKGGGGEVPLQNLDLQIGVNEIKFPAAISRSNDSATRMKCVPSKTYSAASARRWATTATRGCVCRRADSSAAYRRRADADPVGPVGDKGHQQVQQAAETEAPEEGLARTPGPGQIAAGHHGDGVPPEEGRDDDRLLVQVPVVDLCVWGGGIGKKVENFLSSVDMRF
ncbi:unnamed protein product, partial [Trichogramma brassicae]